MDIGLALGGGGARGIAHIGVLRILKKKRSELVQLLARASAA